jgi:6-phosphogluconolactonase
VVEIHPIVVADPSELASKAAEWTAERITQAVEERGGCYIALAGGETPRGCYQRLAQSPYREHLPWAKLFVYWSDERQVPLDDAASNYAMAKLALLDQVPIPRDQIFPLVGDPAPAIAKVPRDARGQPRFDVIHLGMGEDGHTASLFPGHPALQYQSAVVAVLNAPKPPPERLTLSLPVLNAARAVLFMVQGAGKRAAMERVLRRDPSLPASLVHPVNGELAFIIDKAAFTPTT